MTNNDLCHICLSRDSTKKIAEAEIPVCGNCSNENGIELSGVRQLEDFNYQNPDKLISLMSEFKAPVCTVSSFSDKSGLSLQTVRNSFAQAYTSDYIDYITVNGKKVWYPVENKKEPESEEEFLLFPARREIIANKPSKNSQSILSRFSHLVDSSGSGYMYKISEEDIWNSPYDEVESLITDIKRILPEWSQSLEQRIRKYWENAHTFELKTNTSGDTVLVGDKQAMEDVAHRKLEHHTHYTKFITDSKWRIKKGSEAEVKETLYDAGYPVQDNRDIEEGASLDIRLDASLREYQQDWVETFVERKAGTFVGPSGSGKTVASLGVMSELSCETLIIVPKREIATQWKREIIEKTNISSYKIGLYHGKEKKIRPITISTYDTARQSRHRKVFKQRDWGLLVLDEAHKSVAPVWKRVANIQTKARLGLTATPVREAENDKEIYTLIGPPVGTDWAQLFDDGYVQEPEVEIRHISWNGSREREEYKQAKGHQKRQIAAMNTAKEKEIQSLLEKHSDKKKIIFVEWVDQGKRYEEKFNVPFIYGETSHQKRDEYLRQFREGERETLLMSRVGDEGIDLPNAEICIMASGLGGSRAQGGQRTGRVMRPSGEAKVYVLSTKGSNEEDFARKRMEFMSEKGIQVQEQTV